MDNKYEKTIGQLVAHDFRTAAVFKKYKIDFCCKGNRSLVDVAREKGMSVDELEKELEEVQQKVSQTNIDANSWPLDLLTDYIEKKHHRYVESTIPELKQYLEKLCKVHGAKHPELLAIRDHFNASSDELTMHMKKEELILFPWIRKIVQAQLSGTFPGRPPFGSVRNPIAAMMQEHDNEGERFRQIAALSKNYTPPADACNTYKVTFSILEEFEEDLHRHIHLENNILFPKAEKLEATSQLS